MSEVSSIEVKCPCRKRALSTGALASSSSSFFSPHSLLMMLDSLGSTFDSSLRRALKDATLPEPRRTSWT